MTMVGPASKVKPSWRKHVGAAAGRIELLEHRDAVAPGAESDRGGKTAKAAPDHDRMPATTRRPRCPSPYRSGCQHNLTLPVSASLPRGKNKALAVAWRPEPAALP